MALAWEEEVGRAAPFGALDNDAVLRSARGGGAVRERVRWLLATVTPAPRDPAIEVTDRVAARRALARLSTEDRVCILTHGCGGEEGQLCDLPGAWHLHLPLAVASVSRPWG